MGAARNFRDQSALQLAMVLPPRRAPQLAAVSCIDVGRSLHWRACSCWSLLWCCKARKTHRDSGCETSLPSTALDAADAAGQRAHGCRDLDALIQEADTNMRAAETLRSQSALQLAVALPPRRAPQLAVASCVDVCRSLRWRACVSWNLLSCCKPQRTHCRSGCGTSVASAALDAADAAGAFQEYPFPDPQTEEGRGLHLASRQREQSKQRDGAC